MMKIRVLLFIFSFFCITNVSGQILLPQLSAGQAIDTLIYSLNYNFDGTCIPQHEVAVQMDTNYIPIASGLEVYGVISGLISPNDSVLTTEKGYLQNGDTIFFSQAGAIYTFYSAWSGIITIDIYLHGTPTVPFETYPCELLMMCTLGICGNTCFLTANSSQCIVNDPIGIEDNDLIDNVIIYPNPATNFVDFELNSDVYSNCEFFLYNSSGAMLFNKSLGINPKFFTVKTDHLKQGTYFYSFTKFGHSIKSGKFVVNP